MKHEQSSTLAQAMHTYTTAARLVESLQAQRARGEDVPDLTIWLQAALAYEAAAALATFWNQEAERLLKVAIASLD